MTQHQFDTFEIPDTTTPVEPVQPAPIPEATKVVVEAGPAEESRHIAEIIQIGNAIDRERQAELERAA